MSDAPGFGASAFVAREGRRLAEALWREGRANLSLRALNEAPHAVTMLAQVGGRLRLVRHFPSGPDGARRFRRERAARRRWGEAGLIGPLLESDSEGRFLISAYDRGAPAQSVLGMEDLARRVGAWLGRAAAAAPRRNVSARWGDLRRRANWPLAGGEAAYLPVHALAPARDDGAVDHFAIGAGERLFATNVSVSALRPLAWDFALTAADFGRRGAGRASLSILAEAFADEAGLSAAECATLARAAAPR